MKRVIAILIIMMLLPVMVYAQLKKVAVWETKCSDKSITTFQSTMVRGGMETAVGNAAGYEVYDRSAFDAIMKEQKFQRSGVVSDSEIKRLGEMAGVQYIIVPEATASGGEFYILVKMLDVETGKFGAVYEELCGPSGSEIKQACASLGKQLFGGAVDVESISGGFTRFGGSNVGGTTMRNQNFTETAFGIDMRMVYVEGGTFVMGCTGEQGGECESDESPNRQTTVGSFYIGMLEVTQGQWQKVMGTTIYQQRDRSNSNLSIYGVGPDYPMYYVSWEEAKEFCARLSRQTGKTYRLATEAEWEYAARGGKKNEGTKYSGGWSIDDVAWYDGNSGASTHPCGTKRANALGIYDMSGNVREWCEDWYASQYLQYDNNNPKGATSGSGRVCRGGGWFDNAEDCRVSVRNGYAPSNSYNILGFRVVLVP